MSAQGMSGNFWIGKALEKIMPNQEQKDDEIVEDEEEEEEEDEEVKDQAEEPSVAPKEPKAAVAPKDSRDAVVPKELKAAVAPKEPKAAVVTPQSDEKKKARGRPKGTTNNPVGAVRHKGKGRDKIYGRMSDVERMRANFGMNRMRRLAHRSGHLRHQRRALDALRAAYQSMLSLAVRDACILSEHSSRRTLSEEDMRHAFDLRFGRRLYG